MDAYTSNDLYTFTMKQAVWSNYPNASVEYKFFCRNKDVDLRPFRAKIEEKIDDMHGCTPHKAEIEHLRSLGFLSDAYLDELANFYINTNYLEVGEIDDQLAITVQGPWYQCIDFEVPVLRAVNEAYFEQFDTPEIRAEGDRRLTEKIEQLKAIDREYNKSYGTAHPFRLMEFGTRRAFSEQWQYHVIERLANEAPKGMLVGSSNVWAAMQYGLKAQGTMAHQWIMAFQAFSPLHRSQRDAFDCWANEFRGKLGIALSDTLGRKQFLKDFDLHLAMAFTGARQDSGDEYEWGRDLVNHYKSLGIDPMTKSAVFTNSLNITKAYDLWDIFKGQIRPSFGIGTDLTNDMGIPALNIVMKMVKCNGVPLIKISDDPGKVMCENDHLKEWALDLCVR